jgi:1,4-dihydroxy-2-naphthoate octaprenyltransferase
VDGKVPDCIAICRVVDRCRYDRAALVFMHLKTLAASSRPAFLLLTLASVFLGYAAARLTVAGIEAGMLLLVLAGALAAHASVNLLNEYFDFRSGLDLQTQRTPFSGGSGALPADPGAAAAVLVFGLGALVVCIAIGLYLVWTAGPGILLVGIPGVALVVAYTQWLTRRPWLCLAAPGLAFGPLMVTGTAFVLSGEYSATAVIVSLVPFFLASNLLLLNQYPDVEADRAAGRRHLLIMHGARVGAGVYLGFLVAAFTVPVLGVSTGYLPHGALVGLLCLGIAMPLAGGVWRHAEHDGALQRMLAPNVALSLLMPVLIALGMLL